MYEDEAMKAIEEKLSRENTINRDKNPGFFNTTASLPMDWLNVPVYLVFSVSTRARLPEKAISPMTPRTTNTPLQDVNPKRSAPKTGAAMGDMRTMEETQARIISRLRLSYTSFIIAMATAEAELPPIAWRMRKAMS